MATEVKGSYAVSGSVEPTLRRMVGIACGSPTLHWWADDGLRRDFDLDDAKDICLNHPFVRWVGNNQVLIENSLFDLTADRWVAGVDLPGVPLAATTTGTAYLETAPPTTSERVSGLFSRASPSPFTAVEGRDVVQIYTARTRGGGYQGPTSWAFELPTRVAYAFADGKELQGVMTRTPLSGTIDQMNIEQLDGSQATIIGEFFLRKSNLLGFNLNMWATVDPVLQIVTVGIMGSSQTVTYGAADPMVQVLPFYDGIFYVALMTRHAINILNIITGATIAIIEYQLDVHPVSSNTILVDHRRLYTIGSDRAVETDLGLAVQSLHSY